MHRSAQLAGERPEQEAEVHFRSSTWYFGQNPSAGKVRAAFQLGFVTTCTRGSAIARPKTNAKRSTDLLVVAPSAALLLAV
jgi:hypothetical protein